MSRGDILTQQLCLIQLLDRRDEISVTEVVPELHCSVRTIYRDLEVLARAGVPIYLTGQNRWRVLEDYHHNMNLILSCAEMVAMSMSGKPKAGLRGTFFYDATRTVLGKTRTQLSKDLSARVAMMSFLYGAFGAWSGESYPVELIFDETMAERQLHPQQENRLEANGRLRVKIQPPIGLALVAYRVKVPEPTALKTIVQEEHQQILERIHATL